MLLCALHTLTLALVSSFCARFLLKTPSHHCRNIAEDDPNNMLLMEASGGLPLELSADEIEKQLEAILAGRAL